MTTRAVQDGPGTAAPVRPGVDRVVTVPNALSLLRLAGVPLFLWLVLGPHADGWALLLLVVSGATDYLDGFLARRWDQASRLGALLDPAADRLYIVSTLLALLIRDIVPLWLVVALVAREVVIAGLVPVLRSRAGVLALPVHFLGKAATFNLLYAFPLLLLGSGHGEAATVARPIGWAFAVWGSALYWWAGLLYLDQARRFLRALPRTPKEAMS